MLPKNKTVIVAAVGAFCVVQIVVLWMFMRRTAGTDGVEAAERAVTEKAALAAGAPIQRKRIDDAIENASWLDLDQAESSLNVMGDDLKLASAAGVSGSDFGPPSKLHEVLADRRVAKIYAYLKQMPPKDASDRAVKLFDRNLRLHKSDLDRCVARLRGEDKSSDMIPVSGNYHALSAALFLCAVYCEQPVFLQKVDDWQAVVGTMFREGQSDAVLAPLLVQGRGEGPPQNLMLLNLYVMLLERGKDISAADVGKRIKRRLPVFRSVPLCSWDAHTTALDFTHIHRGVPIDSEKVIESFTVAKGWGGVAVNDDRQEMLVDAVRALLE